MSEYIGSRISLISKSDIRYVGTLKAIDSETATVSLENVTCSGTEGRKGDPDQEIPGSDTVYDGIVFRGSDVKDLTILAPPKENKPPQMPNDPAILGPTPSQPPPQPQQQQQQQQPPPPPPPQQQQQQPPNQFRGPPYQQQNHFGYQGPPPGQFQQQPRFQGPGGPHGFPGSPGAVPGYGMGYGGPPPPPGYGMGMGYGPPPGQGFQQHPHAPFPPQHQLPIGTPGAQINQQRPPPPAQQQAPIGSKQGTPQPTANQAPQPPSQPKPTDPASTAPAPPATGTSAPTPPLDSKPPASAAAAPSAAAQPPPPAAIKAAQRANNRVAVPLPAPNAGANRAPPKPIAPQPNPLIPAATQPAGTATDAATAAVAAAMAKLSGVNHQAGTVDNLTQKVQQMRVQDGQNRGRGRGRGGGGAPRGGRRESAHKTVDVPKEDFDFESANAKFNKHELAKEAIATGNPIPDSDIAAPFSPPTSAATAAILATNGHLHSATDDAATDDVVIPAKPERGGGYDKKSSFFDNISSDLKDRGEQKVGGEFVDGRSMRREERSKNMETFGQGSVDGGGYRGRGRGRGRGYGRGGGRGFFAGGGGGRGGTRGRGRGDAETALPL